MLMSEVLRDHGVGLGKYKINSQIYYKNLGLNYPPSKRLDTVASTGGANRVVKDSNGNFYIKSNDIITKLDSNLNVVWTRQYNTIPNFQFRASSYNNDALMVVIGGKLYTTLYSNFSTSYKSVVLCIDTATGNLDYYFTENVPASSSILVILHAIPVPGEANNFYISYETFNTSDSGAVRKVTISSSGTERVITGIVWTKDIVYGNAPYIAVTPDNQLVYADYYGTSSYALRRVNSAGTETGAVTGYRMPLGYAQYGNYLYFIYDKLYKLNTTTMVVEKWVTVASAGLNSKVLDASANAVYVRYAISKGFVSKLNASTLAEEWTVFEDVPWLFEQTTQSRHVGLIPGTQYGAAYFYEYLTITG